MSRAVSRSYHLSQLSCSIHIACSCCHQLCSFGLRVLPLQASDLFIMRTSTSSTALCSRSSGLLVSSTFPDHSTSRSWSTLVLLRTVAFLTSGSSLFNADPSSLHPGSALIGPWQSWSRHPQEFIFLVNFLTGLSRVPVCYSSKHTIYIASFCCFLNLRCRTTKVVGAWIHG